MGGFLVLLDNLHIVYLMHHFTRFTPFYVLMYIAETTVTRKFLEILVQLI